MSVKLRKNKKTGEERWVAAPSYRGEKFPQRTFDTKAAALKYEREVKEAAIEGRVAQYFDDIEEKALVDMRSLYNAALAHPNVWKSATRYQPGNAFRFCEWYGWTSSPLKINTRTVKDFIEYRNSIKNPLSAKTINHYLAAITQLLKTGVYEEWYKEQDVIQVNILREREDNSGEKRDSLPEGDIAKLVDYFAGMPTEVELYFRMLLYYGRRNKEITRLKRRHIMLEKKPKPVIRFLNQKKQGKPNEVFLPLLEDVEPTLMRWLEERGEMEPDDLLFDQCRRPRTASEMLSAISEELLNHRWTPRDFRNTCLTRMGEAGVAPVVLKEWAGHEHITTTMGYIKPRADAFMGVDEQLRAFNMKLKKHGDNEG